ncbi:endonuclease/exonuclease/phosphatase family protein [Sphingomonas parva]|uniref:Endonuclease/exonuclease/phosphatase family protein n=1 Tax=Sphingomonas parva TaxID=2555898 RepID=A0A4Y8ZWN1_9SPHN|nr:endonuclease/exonuclease/phosphatase family protein [Sphingomonas parva]
MRRLLLLALCATAVPAGGASPAGTLRVMSFNVRVPVAQDGRHAWPHRRDLLVDTIASQSPDVVGTQELTRAQGDYLLARLPGYSWFGIDRRGGHDDEHMAIFYRRDRLRLVELGNFWLSETPNVPGSISWGHPFPRMVTWGLFETIADGRRFYVYNTHFPYRAGDEPARTRAAAAIAARIAALPAAVPVVLTGDFNTEPGSPTYALLSGSLADARAQAGSVAGPEGTFHAFTGTPRRRIDWILARGLRAARFHTDDRHRDGLYPSDHFPVTADFVPESPAP